LFKEIFVIFGQISPFLADSFHFLTNIFLPQISRKRGD